MKSSFCIWLARDNAAWQSVELNALLPKTHPPESFSPLIPKAKIKNSLPNSVTLSKSPAGFIYKGNTCYANTILKALSVISFLWRTSSGESAQLSPLLKSIALKCLSNKDQLSQLTLPIFCGHLRAKFLLLTVLFLILTPWRKLQKFYKKYKWRGDGIGRGWLIYIRVWMGEQGVFRISFFFLMLLYFVASCSQSLYLGG